MLVLVVSDGQLADLGRTTRSDDPALTGSPPRRNVLTTGLAIASSKPSESDVTRAHDLRENAGKGANSASSAFKNLPAMRLNVPESSKLGVRCMSSTTTLISSVLGPIRLA
jgi:hypothetical protein